jgi:hypothetical protein
VASVTTDSNGRLPNTEFKVFPAGSDGVTPGAVITDGTDGTRDVGDEIADSLATLVSTGIGNIPAVPTQYALSGSLYTVQHSQFNLTADGDIIAAQGSGNEIYVVKAIISVDLDAKLVIKDGSGGTVRGNYYVPARGGFRVEAGDWPKGTANTALYLDLTAGGAINVGGHISWINL